MDRNGVSYRVLMLFCSNAILQLMGFVYRVILSRYAGAAALGLNSLVMQLYGIMVSVCISGLGTAVSALSARLERDRISALLKTALAVYAALWTAMALPVFFLGGVISAGVLGNIGLKRTLYLMLFCIFMTGVENILKSVHMGTRHVKPCAASELLEQGVRFSLVTLLLKHAADGTDDGTVFLIMLGMTLSEFVSVGFLSVSFFRSFGFRGFGKREKLMVGELSRIAFPATLTSVSSTVFASAGSLLLPNALVSSGMEYGAALAEIGVMNTVSVPITMLPMALIGAVSAVIMPEISKAQVSGKDPKPFIVKVFAVTAAFGAASLTVLSVFSGRIAELFFSRSIDVGLFVLFAVKAFIIFLQIVSIAVLNGLMHQKKVLVFAVTGEAYQLALILLLSPVLGMRGYCAGMIAGELLRLVLNLFAIAGTIKSCGFRECDMVKSKKTFSL